MTGSKSDGWQAEHVSLTVSSADGPVEDYSPSHDRWTLEARRVSGTDFDTAGFRSGNRWLEGSFRMSWTSMLVPEQSEFVTRMLRSCVRALTFNANAQGRAIRCHHVSQIEIRVRWKQI